MKLKKTAIKDLVILKTQIFRDKRGFLKETYQKKILNRNLIFDIMSSSKKNVLRGLHIQLKHSQGKLITVTEGKIFDVAVDLRRNSKSFGKYFSIIISKTSDFSLYIPEGFAHGFCGLDKENIIFYSCSEYRNKASETGIKWDDEDLNINWPIKKPIISQKDKKNFSLKEYLKLI